MSNTFLDLPAVWQYLRNESPIAFQDERLFFTALVCVVRSFCFWGNCFYFMVLIPLIPGSSKWKLKHNAPSPSAALVRKAFTEIMFAHLIISPIFNWFLYPFRETIGVTLDPASIPSIGALCLQVMFCVLCEDFGFYWIHRLVHHPLLYGPIHKHHHEFKTNIALAGEYFSPFEFVLNTLPFLLGPFLLKVHMLTFIVWAVVRICEFTDAHSGYALPWSVWNALLKVQGGADRHEFHHSKNMGNYGSYFRFWDWAMGTDVKYRQWLQAGGDAKKK